LLATQLFLTQELFITELRVKSTSGLCGNDYILHLNIIVFDTHVKHFLCNFFTINMFFYELW